MSKKSLFIYRIIAIIIPIMVLIFFLIKDILINLVTQVPVCPFYSYLHLYCPACGNTRSVSSLLHGDILSAAHYNITPLLFGFFFLLGYIELVAICFRKPILLVPRRTAIYIVLIILLCIYLIARNFIPSLAP